MSYQTVCDAKAPESVYESKARQWSAAKEALDTATQQQHAATEAMTVATQQERDAWDELEAAAGRAMPKPPSALPRAR